LSVKQRERRRGRASLASGRGIKLRISSGVSLSS
jgi:hypothetical protein